MSNIELNQGVSSAVKRRLLVSFLIFGGTTNILRLLEKIPEWLREFATARSFDARIIVRNNNPTLAVESVRKGIETLSRHYDDLDITFIDGEPNLGFGRGHNENYRLSPADFLLILNDDLDFPDLQWLHTAIDTFDKDERLALLGESSNPQLISPFYANGTFNVGSKNYPIQYAEASVLLARGTAFEAIGMFDESIEWAMSEDADLSLKAQQMGYRIDWISMPHQHWRSSSFHSLPSYAKSSIKEHNRARLFAKWGYSLASGEVGKIDIIDVSSSGIGDVFCALFHVCAEYHRLPKQFHDHMVVNTTHPEVARLVLPATAQIESELDFQGLIERYRERGIANIRTTRTVNYALPFNIHPLIAGALSLPVASKEVVAEAMANMRKRALALTSVSIPDAPYCALHVEFTRVGHDGRGPSPAVVESMVRAACAHFAKVVVVGTQQLLSFEFLGPESSKIVDLQGQLDLQGLAATVMSASAFVGIDSFPAHIAQMSEIPSAVFFGSVHPMARVWNEKTTWPICAELACLGCYHEHIEPSAPFCLRRDNACTVQVADATIKEVVANLSVGKPFEWTALRRRFERLQAKFVHMLTYHPAPPGHFLKNTLPNEDISNIIYDLTEKIASLSGRHMQSTILEKFRTQNAKLKNEVLQKEVSIEALREQATASLQNSTAGKKLVTMDIFDLIKDCRSCSIESDEEWTIITSQDGDPQVEFKPIVVDELPFHISIIATSEENTRMKLYWRYGTEPFGEHRAISLHLAQHPKHLLFNRLVEKARPLYFRLDPAESACAVRLLGRVSGSSVTIPPNTGGRTETLWRRWTSGK